MVGKSYMLILTLYIGSGKPLIAYAGTSEFAQFYCISVTNFSTVSECILLEIIWIKKNIFFTFLWLFLCLHAM